MEYQSHSFVVVKELERTTYTSDVCTAARRSTAVRGLAGLTMNLYDVFEPHEHSFSQAIGAPAHILSPIQSALMMQRIASNTTVE